MYIVCRKLEEREKERERKIEIRKNVKFSFSIIFEIQ